MSMESPRTLRDFYVKLTADGAQYKSYVERSPAGQGAGPFTPPIMPTELEPLRQRLSEGIPGMSCGDPIVSSVAAQSFGDILGKGLFQGDVRSLFDSSLESVKAKGEDLRISIHLDLSEPNLTWLGQLPWELIRDDHQFLLLDRSISLARCLDLRGSGLPIQIRQPLKILVAVANPSELTPLDGKSDFNALKTSFHKSPSVKIELLEKATSKSLAEALDNDFHIVHLVGHALFDSRDGKGYFLLEADSGLQNRISAEELASLLHGKTAPNFLVLNACRTASFCCKNGEDPWSGLATALLKKGFPSVVAMQWPITDEAAISFSRGFYGSLAAGHDVDRAVTAGRRAIFVDDPHSLEWATPVLFLRGMEQSFRIKPRRVAQQSVVVEVQRDRQDRSPEYKDRLVSNLTRYLQIAPSDLKRRSEDGNRFTIELPYSAAVHILRTTSESCDTAFKELQGQLSITTIQKVPEAPAHTLVSALITLSLGILGNLIAALLESERQYFFTLQRIGILLLLTIIFLYWDAFARLRRKLGPQRIIATLVACVVLLACFALPAFFVPGPDCHGLQVSRVELDVAPLVELTLSGERITDLSNQNIQLPKHLSGRGILSKTDTHCICKWSGKTDQERDLIELDTSADGTFTIDLPDHYNWIYLMLQIDERKYLFSIHVQRSST
jgi:hypothetical protein